MRRSGLITAFVVALVALSGCSDSDADATSTTVAATTERSTSTVDGGPTAPGTTDGPPVTATPDDGSIAADAFAIPEYSIEAREAADTGDTVVVLLAPGTYTDLDLENVVADVVQRFAPIATVHVVDTQDAVSLVLGEPESLEIGDVSSLDEHYFARLEEGFRLVFEGPFGNLPEVILGS